MHSIGLALVDSELKVCMMISPGCDDQMSSLMVSLVRSVRSAPGVELRTFHNHPSVPQGGF